MLLDFKRLALLTSIAAGLASNQVWAGKDAPPFTPKAAASYPSHQTSAGVTIGVSVVVSDEDAEPAFGKHNPYKYGVMPVLVVMQNDSNKAIRVDGLEVLVEGADGYKVEATPARDVRFLIGPRQPSLTPAPPIAKLGKHKNPLDTWEIEGRAFAAKMLPPGQSASGFFYFQTGYLHGSSLYLSGLREADSGKALLYFEIPMEEK